MSYINWNYKKLKKCVICGKPIKESYFVCLYCKNPCEIYLPEEYNLEIGYVTTRIISKCCNGDISQEYVNITCSAQCHEEYVKEMEVNFGKYQTIFDNLNNVYRLVPLRIIIEKGINRDELDKFIILNKG